MKKEYNFSKMKAEKNPYASKKKSVGINLSREVIDYFKKLSVDSGVPYQTLIDMYLLDCVNPTSVKSGLASNSCLGF